MNRKYKDRNTRKLVRLGATSLGLTLPVEIVENLKWRGGQKVVVRQKGKLLMVSDFKSKKRK